MKQQRKWLYAIPLVCAAVFTAINPQPIYAIFGIGDVVFDPSSWAEIGSVWGQDISNGAKLIETYNQTVKIYDNAVQAYNIANQMAQRIENKNTWKTAAFAVGSEVMQQHYNENINWSAVMNGDVVNAGTAWRQSTYAAPGAGYLGTATASNSQRMAQFATLQMLDQTSARCASILANYKATQDANQAAQSKLANDTYDASDLKNATVAVLNVISGGHINLQNQQQAAGNLQTCLAEQQTLQNKVTRDHLAVEQGYYSDIATARATESVQYDPTAAAGFIAGTNWTEP
jgi:hypothetical protein